MGGLKKGSLLDLIGKAEGCNQQQGGRKFSPRQPRRDFAFIRQACPSKRSFLTERSRDKRNSTKGEEKASKSPYIKSLWRTIKKTPCRAQRKNQKSSRLGKEIAAHTASLKNPRNGFKGQLQEDPSLETRIKVSHITIFPEINPWEGKTESQRNGG